MAKRGAMSLGSLSRDILRTSLFDTYSTLLDLKNTLSVIPSLPSGSTAESASLPLDLNASSCACQCFLCTASMSPSLYLQHCLHSCPDATASHSRLRPSRVPCYFLSS
ncbi:hypothetical protein K474DRAFT_740560 [Panus rudis PR-1116 ss-1]|nr:hypothetical protein K474DRAFT_740560 [Panus rudis PR-1116 ss-1]